MELFGYDLETMMYWHWWVLAGVFFVLEVLTLSFFFLWVGVAAILVGFVHLVVPALTWQVLFSIWAILSVAGAIGIKIYKKKNPNSIKSDHPHLNRRGQQYVGRTFTLEVAIENGFGKVKVDDSTWKVEAKTDAPKGTKVRVTGIDGTVLLVEPDA